MTGDNLKCTFIIRTQGCIRNGVAAKHFQNLKDWFYHVPGLKIVIPSAPYDAKGL